jgi:hypothetical protein
MWWKTNHLLHDGQLEKFENGKTNLQQEQVTPGSSELGQPARLLIHNQTYLNYDCRPAYIGFKM